MGEIADMMLDGTLCEGCGEFIDHGEADGFPRYCSQTCAKDRGVDFNDFDDEDDDDEDEEITIEDIIDLLNVETLVLLDTAKDLKRLKKSNKAKALKGLAKTLKIFTQSLEALK